MSPTEFRRLSLRGVDIPLLPPASGEWRLSAQDKERLPPYFEGAIESINNAGREFSYYCRRYQSEPRTNQSIMTSLLASWDILAQNIPALLQGIQHLKPEEKAKAGGSEGVKQISEKVKAMAALIEPYRQAMSMLAHQGDLGTAREDEGYS